MPLQRILLASIVVCAVWVVPEVAEACGGFTIHDHRSKDNLIFYHNATLIERDERRHQALWIYADYKEYDVFGIVHTKGPLSHLHTTKLSRKLPVYNHKAAYELKQLWFSGRQLFYEAGKIGEWTSGTLIVGDQVFKVEFTKSGNEQPSPYHGVWNVKVSLGNETILSGEHVNDICPSKKWPRSTKSEQLDVVWKRITLYLAAELLASKAKPRP